MPDDLLKPPAPRLVVDGRDMQPPEPLEKTLEGLDLLADGEELLLLVYCHPVPLFNILRNNGYAWQEEVQEDGTHEIRIRRA
jgi:uncharacterized protein (DUF2249 family)